MNKWISPLYERIDDDRWKIIHHYVYVALFNIMLIRGNVVRVAPAVASDTMQQGYGYGFNGIVSGSCGKQVNKVIL